MLIYILKKILIHVVLFVKNKRVSVDVIHLEIIHSFDMDFRNLLVQYTVVHCRPCLVNPF